MRIARSLMLGVAGSVLTAGAAMAADPMPIVVSTVPAITVPVPGRAVAIDVEAGVGFSAGNGLFLSAGMGGTIDVTSATGWGMRFEGSHFTFLAPFFSGGGEGTLTLYRAFGDLELGVWAGGGFGYPPFGFGVGAGLSANYEHEGPRLYVSSENSLMLFPFIDFETYTELEFDLNDRFTLSSYFSFSDLGNFYGGVGVDVHATDRIEFWANLYYNSGGLGGLEVGGEMTITDRISVWTEANFDFGPFQFDWIDFGATMELTETLKIESVLSFDSPFVFDYAEVWAELDRPIGTGPLSVIAALGVGYEGGFGPYAWGNIGLRYKLGGPEDRDDNRLFGDGS